MKILLMSDNHGRWPKVHELVEYYRPQVDLILHCGDSEFAPDDPVWEKVDAVAISIMSTLIANGWSRQLMTINASLPSTAIPMWPMPRLRMASCSAIQVALTIHVAPYLIGPMPS